MLQIYICANFDRKYQMIAELKRHKVNMFCKENCLFSPRVLVWGIPARVKFIPMKTDLSRSDKGLLGDYPQKCTKLKKLTRFHQNAWKSKNFYVQSKKAIPRNLTAVLWDKWIGVNVVLFKTSIYMWKVYVHRHKVSVIGAIWIFLKNLKKNCIAEFKTEYMYSS